MWRTQSTFCLCALLAGACDPDPTEGHDGFTSAEFAKVRTLGPLPSLPPPNTTNRYADNGKAAIFGQQLFFEKSYASALTIGDDGMNGASGAVGEKGKLACASCHDPKAWYVDTRTKPGNVSLGVLYTSRNAPSLVNVGFYEWFGWGGKQDSLWMQGAQGAESKDNFASDRLTYAHMLYNKYKDVYNSIFPVPLDAALASQHAEAARFPPKGKPKSAPADADGPWEGMAKADQEIINVIVANSGKAIEAFERRLLSRNARLDRYIGGDDGALSAAAKRGLRLFIGKAACDGCHKGPSLTDHQFHDTAVPQAVGTNVPAVDDGRFQDVSSLLKSSFSTAGRFSDDPAAGMKKLEGLAAVDADRGKFRTKALRQVAQTGPYMHNGSMKTLEEVVLFYDAGGATTGFSGTKDPKMVPLNLSAAERADLVVFLREALTGEEVPSALGIDTAVP